MLDSTWHPLSETQIIPSKSSSHKLLASPFKGFIADYVNSLIEINGPLNCTAKRNGKIGQLLSLLHLLLQAASETDKDS